MMFVIGQASLPNAEALAARNGIRNQGGPLSLLALTRNDSSIPGDRGDIARAEMGNRKREDTPYPGSYHFAAKTWLVPLRDSDDSVLSSVASHQMQRALEGTCHIFPPRACSNPKVRFRQVLPRKARRLPRQDGFFRPVYRKLSRLRLCARIIAKGRDSGLSAPGRLGKNGRGPGLRTAARYLEG